MSPIKQYDVAVTYRYSDDHAWNFCSFVAEVDQDSGDDVIIQRDYDLLMILHAMAVELTEVEKDEELDNAIELINDVFFDQIVERKIELHQGSVRSIYFKTVDTGLIFDHGILIQTR